MSDELDEFVDELEEFDDSRDSTPTEYYYPDNEPKKKV